MSPLQSRAWSSEPGTLGAEPSPSPGTGFTERNALWVCKSDSPARLAAQTRLFSGLPLPGGGGAAGGGWSPQTLPLTRRRTEGPGAGRGSPRARGPPLGSEARTRSQGTRLARPQEPGSPWSVSRQPGWARPGAAACSVSAAESLPGAWGSLSCSPPRPGTSFPPRRPPARSASLGGPGRDRGAFPALARRPPLPLCRDGDGRESRPGRPLGAAPTPGGGRAARGGGARPPAEAGPRHELLAGLRDPWDGTGSGSRAGRTRERS